MPIKCWRVSERDVGAKVSGPALTDSLIWDGESTHVPVNLDLKEPSGSVGTSGILVVECKVLECGWVVVVVVGCGLCSVEEFQNLVPEFVCLGSWFQNLIILKSFKFLIFLIRLVLPNIIRNFPPSIFLILFRPNVRHTKWNLNGKYFENGGTLPIWMFLSYNFYFLTLVKALPNARWIVSPNWSLPGWVGYS